MIGPWSVWPETTGAPPGSCRRAGRPLSSETSILYGVDLHRGPQRRYQRPAESGGACDRHSRLGECGSHGAFLSSDLWSIRQKVRPARTRVGLGPSNEPHAPGTRCVTRTSIQWDPLPPGRQHGESRRETQSRDRRGRTAARHVVDGPGWGRLGRRGRCRRRTGTCITRCGHHEDAHAVSF